MDGNGRWATQRGLPRLLGHKEGVEALVRAVRAFAKRGVQILTVYAFSTENWSRPESEVSGLMSLVPTAMKAHLNQLAVQGVRLRAVGDLSALSPKVRQAFLKMEDATAGNRRMTVNVAFNYGGRWDVVQACKRAMAAGVEPDQLDEHTLGRYMALADTPDPDLLIRTGGECRLSNFLLWQLAYAEMYFTERLWPEFDDEDVQHALTYYASRERRFGSLPDHHPPGPGVGGTSPVRPVRPVPGGNGGPVAAHG
ncbi:MAG: di-trans,poly-cis-decaprenylcistransferase [Betaproteobacteria bacterium]|nr:di-trans,poly-cis-decaprenylcistransferase [Betaproteobacteria bacterium]NBX96425.1 di-trans,poly-cis-decaprenylcistransferase [Betaproteobacteria bacterium]